MPTTARTTALALALAAMAAAPSAALARHGADDAPGDDHGGAPGARVAGSCTDGSRVKLKVKPDDGRLETELEVDQNRNGVTWTVKIRRDGTLVVDRHATTHAPSGSFSVEKKIANPAGSDRVSARATSPSGEVCTASLTI
jgi:hypothetical protein